MLNMSHWLLNNLGTFIFFIFAGVYLKLFSNGGVRNWKKETMVKALKTLWPYEILIYSHAVNFVNKLASKKELTITRSYKNKNKITLLANYITKTSTFNRERVEPGSCESVVQPFLFNKWNWRSWLALANQADGYSLSELQRNITSLLKPEVDELL